MRPHELTSTGTMGQPLGEGAIRVAEPGDVDEISRVLCACYEGFIRSDSFAEHVVEALKAVRGSSECVQNEIATGDVFVAEVENRIAGIVSIRDNEVARLYVAPEHQMRGVGTRLFAHAEARIRGNGCARLTLGALGPSALPFYERLGMRIVGEREIINGPCAGMTTTILEKQLTGEDRT